MSEKKIRVLLAKPGLDGHDRGVKVVARHLRDQGFEVIYMGLRQTPAQIAAVAMEEDVAVVGLSVLSGAHVPLTRKVRAELAARRLADVKLLIGGTIPADDVSELKQAGADAIFPTGARLEEISAYIRSLG
jgi:methylmalonyl-CoA mutase C-terminal domain/subunit